MDRWMSACEIFAEFSRGSLVIIFIVPPIADAKPKSAGASAPHHFDTVDHIGGYLLQTVNTRKSGKHRTGIHEYLRIMSVKTIDADLRESAVLAIILTLTPG